MQVLIASISLALGCLVPDIVLAGPSWSEWERANSVAHEGDWLVIRQPDEGFCYIKQSYDADPSKIVMLMKKDRVPYLVTPFFHGVEGDVSYQVDSQPLRLVQESKATQVPIALSGEVVPEMEKGTRLRVRVKPKGKPTLEQIFSLRGFSAASKRLGSDTCRKKVPDQS